MIFAVAAGLFLLNACKPVEKSIYPLYSDNDIIVDDSLVGKWHPGNAIPAYEYLENFHGRPWRDGEWVASETVAEITKPQPTGKYYLLERDIGREVDVSEVRLVRLGNYLFVDVQTPDLTKTNFGPKPIVPYPLITIHFVGRIKISSTAIVVRLLESGSPAEPGTLLDLKSRNQLPPGFRSDAGLLEASTEQLQSFALGHAEDPKVFSGRFDYCRSLDIDCGLEVPLEETKYDPQDAAALYELAIAYMLRDRFNEAWAAWQRTSTVLQKGGEKERSLQLTSNLSLAEAFMDWGHPESGLAVLNAGTQKFPDEYAAWDALGAGYLHLNRTAEAIGPLTKGLERWNVSRTAEIIQNRKPLLPPPPPPPVTSAATASAITPPPTTASTPRPTATLEARPSLEQSPELKADLAKLHAEIDQMKNLISVLPELQSGNLVKVRGEMTKCKGSRPECSISEGLERLIDFAEGNYQAVENSLAELLPSPTPIATPKSSASPVPSQAATLRKAEPDNFRYWRYLILRHEGKSGPAAELLKEPLQGYVAGPLLEILAREGVTELIVIKELGPFLRGEIDGAQFLAQNLPRKGRVISPELCVAYFMMGEKHLLDGDRNKAAEAFQKSVDTHAYTYAEWIVARERLKQLRAVPA